MSEAGSGSYCGNCGTQLRSGAVFCASCGRQAGVAPASEDTFQSGTYSPAPESPAFQAASVFFGELQLLDFSFSRFGNTRLISVTYVAGIILSAILSFVISRSLLGVLEVWESAANAVAGFSPVEPPPPGLGFLIVLSGLLLFFVSVVILRLSLELAAVVFRIGEVARNVSGGSQGALESRPAAGETGDGR